MIEPTQADIGRKVTFAQNKYHRWYFAIVRRYQVAPIERGENHHIVPRCLGGSNAKGNLVTLPYRAHFIVHWLLTKMCAGRAKRQMQHALHRMQRRSGVQASWQYEIGRRAHVAALRGAVSSPESNRKRSAALKGVRKSESALLSMSAAQKGKTPSPETRERLSRAQTGKKMGPHTAATIKKISATKRRAEFEARRAGTLVLL